MTRIFILPGNGYLPGATSDRCSAYLYCSDATISDEKAKGELGWGSKVDFKDELRRYVKLYTTSSK